MAAVANEPEAALTECSRYGLVSELPETDLPTLYAVPGLLRLWMTAPERLDAEAARATHRHLAHFWKVCFELRRAPQLRVDVDAELSACREHSRLGDDPDTFRWATVMLARGFERHAEWRLAYTLLNEILDGDRDAYTLAALGSLEVFLADYPAARTNFERALAMLQAIGDRAGEAGTWHNLASIDLREGHYPDARANFERALVICQAIGDRAGEAAAFFQLGMLADRLGRTEAGARLVAVCWLIDDAVGHGDAESALRTLAGLCGKAGLDETRFKKLLAEVAETYKVDRGRSLIDRAFG